MASLDGRSPPDLRAAPFEARLRSTLDHLLEGAQIIDPEWRYVYVNPAAARHGGIPEDELVGRSMLEAYPGIDATPMFAVLRRAMEMRERAELDNEFIRPDGTVRWFQLVIEPVPEGLFILSLDITDRKRAEQELRKSRARVEAIMENLQEGLILADLEGNLLHWNRAALAMLGFSNREEASAAAGDFAKLFELFTVDGSPVRQDQRPLARALRGEEFHDLELRVSRVGHEWHRIFAYSGALVRYGDNDALAFVTVNDITERKEFERQFVRAQRMDSIGMLSGGIAHDLNNVLFPILLGTSVLRRLNTDQRATRTIDNIERSAKRGADLVKQVLSFARGVTTPWTPLNFRDIVAEVESFVGSTFPKNVTLRTVIAPDLTTFSGDATQLLQIVLNLCVNARDAMPNGGRITISANNTRVSERTARTKRVNPGHYVAFEVADEGVGMPKDVLDKVFDAFFTTKAAGKGTGLGLFTVQDIVRGHGGFTDVFSEVGKGTTFSVFLPAYADADAPKAVEPAIEELPHGAGQLILIVDDEITVLNVVRETLEAFDYEVITAEDGAQGIALYARRRSEISVVVTDMMMPVLDGAAMIAALLHMNPDLPIIATSGTSSEDWRARAERAGAKYLLTKPYSAPLLLRLLATIFAPGTYRG